MTNEKICKMFAVASSLGMKLGNKSSLHLHIEGNNLFSYATLIAHNDGNGVVTVNLTKYSRTTSKHQSLLMRELAKTTAKVNTIYGVRINSDLFDEKTLLLNKMPAVRATLIKQ